MLARRNCQLQRSFLAMHARDLAPPVTSINYTDAVLTRSSSSSKRLISTVRESRFFFIDTEYVSSSLSFCHAVHGPQGTGHTFHANSDGRHANDANPLSFIMCILYMYMTHTHPTNHRDIILYIHIYYNIQRSYIYISFICIGTRKTQTGRDTGLV